MNFFKRKKPRDAGLEELVRRIDYRLGSISERLSYLEDAVEDIDVSPYVSAPKCDCDSELVDVELQKLRWEIEDLRKTITSGEVAWR